MANYYVLIPCTMSVGVEVEARNETEAKQMALEVDFSVNLSSDSLAKPEIYEFEIHDIICRGNVYYGCINEVSVEEL